LMPLAQEARKPMFYLKPADGAMGSHMQAVQSAFTDFNKLAKKIAQQSNIPVLSSLPRSPDDIER
ncbi:MAG TPA: hypothetical protein VGT82_14340, partial [Ktedonobacteraceae bacterium]|nr:hypothetical protein [Ktedonobacteraceae bacterium]